MAIGNINRLKEIADKPSRHIIGLMSGTSLDGLDIALCKISGSGTTTKLGLVKFATVPYSKEVKARIKEVFAKRQISFLAFTELNAWIGMLHGKMILKTLNRWKITPNQIDVIASHGQTVFHSPKFANPNATINSTFQAGDGDHVAVTTGIITLSDFRQKHVAAGGEGAPLAVYGDYLLFSKEGEDRIMLNIGGIANITYLPASCNPKKVFATDTGPGNTLLDQTVQYQFPGQYFDSDSTLAIEGKVDNEMLKVLKSDPFFKLPFPKTTGPELFNRAYLKSAASALGAKKVNVKDMLATLNRLSAETIAEAITKVMRKTKRFNIYVSGGGAHNPLLIESLKGLLPNAKFHAIADLGISGDAKEAVLFAVLANETLCGVKLNFGKRTKIPSVSMGKISFPD